MESMSSCSWSSVMPTWKRSFTPLIVARPRPKQGSCEPAFSMRSQVVKECRRKAASQGTPKIAGGGRSGPPPSTWFVGPTRVHIPKRHLEQFSHFTRGHGYVQQTDTCKCGLTMAKNDYQKPFTTLSFCRWQVLAFDISHTPCILLSARHKSAQLSCCYQPLL